MLRLIFAPLLLLVLLAAGCPAPEEEPPADDERAAAPPPEELEREAAATPVDRGREIFLGTDYSSTGLSCGHCHAIMPQDEQNRIFIAHSGYGMARRGAWWVETEEQLQAGAGSAATLVDAANRCIGEPYLDHGDELLSDDDAAALEAFLNSIAQDDEAFMIAKADKLPPAGLTPDKANGKLVFEQSCTHCHDAGIEGMPELADAGEWLNQLQLMAKIRKLPGDWYGRYENVSYGDHEDLPPVDDEVVTPEGVESDSHAEHDEEGEEHDVFEEGAMPWYATDILTDQQVVDVAFYIVEDLKAEPEAETPQTPYDAMNNSGEADESGE